MRNVAEATGLENEAMNECFKKEDKMIERGKRLLAGVMVLNLITRSVITFITNGIDIYAIISLVVFLAIWIAIAFGSNVVKWIYITILAFQLIMSFNHFTSLEFMYRTPTANLLVLVIFLVSAVSIYMLVMSRAIKEYMYDAKTTY